jgi:nucleotide-binding universal stress UspA family protein
MYKAILVGIDGSATANAALRRAAKLAGTTGAELHVVCAYQTASLAALAPGGGVDVGGAGSDRLLDSLRSAAEEALGAAVKELGVDGIKVQTHAIEGEATDVIIDSADALGCDLIVIGSRGMRGGKRFLLGSVPNSVAHHADRDVLIIHTT